eukprot:3294903-Alexandrium_andersonii.AAC.1
MGFEKRWRTQEGWGQWKREQAERWHTADAAFKKHEERVEVQYVHLRDEVLVTRNNLKEVGEATAKNTAQQEDIC